MDGYNIKLINKLNIFFLLFYLKNLNNKKIETDFASMVCSVGLLK